MRYLLDFAVVGCLSYWLFGYAIAWSDGNSFVGWNNWAFANLPPEKYEITKIQITVLNHLLEHNCLREYCGNFVILFKALTGFLSADIHQHGGHHRQRRCRRASQLTLLFCLRYSALR